MDGFRDGYALVIGVGGYLIQPEITRSGFQSLPAAVRDAQIVHHTLVDPEKCGYLPGNVQLVTEERATASSIRSELKALTNRVSSDATTLIFFSGHGGRVHVQGRWQVFLCPREADPNDLINTAISGDEFSSLLAAVPARRLLVVLDTCHASGSAEFKANRNLGIWKAGLPNDYFAALSQGSGRVIIASSKEDQSSYIRGDLSQFTYHFVAALGGAASVRGDGLIRVLDVFHYVNEFVQRDEPRQVPILKVKDLDLNFPIALNRGGKSAGNRDNQRSIAATLRERIILDPIAGAKTLSQYLQSSPAHADRRTEVDMKRSEMTRAQDSIELFGPNDNDRFTLNRATFFLLKVCAELETGDLTDLAS